MIWLVGVGSAVRNKAYLVSLRYAPGLAKEFCLLARNLQREHWDVTLVLARAYAWLMEDCEANFEIVYVDVGASLLRDALDFAVRGWDRIGRMFRDRPPGLLLFYNTHPLNVFMVRLAERLRPDSYRVLFCHEPYKPQKRVYGYKGQLRILGAEFINAVTLRWSTDVIVPSRIAAERFKLRYPRFRGRLHECTLLVPDLSKVSKPRPERKYFSYVGRVNRATGFRLFTALVNHVVSNGLDLNFAIITPDSVEGSFPGSVSGAAPNLVHLINRPRISDEDIYQVLGTSLGVLRLDEEITQSGVVPLAYSAGTPVIARGIPGLVQHVRHLDTGYVVPEQPTMEHLVGALQYVRDHFDVLSRGARLFYERSFSEAQWQRYYNWIR